MSATAATSSAGPLPPFLVRRENIARYEAGIVHVLDRRAYPFERSFVRCDGVEEVARAIEDMVTQSYGPGWAAGYGFARAARDIRNSGPDKRRQSMAALEGAARRLVATRPTNNHIRTVVLELLQAARSAVERGDDPEQAALDALDSRWRLEQSWIAAIGQAGAALIRDGDRVLTHCWADAPFTEILRTAIAQGKRFRVTCTETRPYLQGARLTADAVSELGLATTLITDGMAASLMAAGEVDRVFAGADRVTMDGHWINKVGTLPIALAAARFGVDIYAICFSPDIGAATAIDVEIEVRDGNEVLYARGIRTAADRAEGLYPAFDVTPPDLVTGYVTPRGVVQWPELARWSDPEGGNS